MPATAPHPSGSADLLAHVREDVRRAGVASARLAVVVQEERPAGRWLTRDEALADGARALGDLVDSVARARPGLDPRLVWRGIPSAMAWPLASTATRVLEASGRLLRLGPATVRLRVGDGDGAWVDGVWFPHAALWAPAGDPLAGHPGVHVAGAPERLARLAADLVAFTEPVVASAASRARVGTRGLWGAVADCALGVLAERRPGDAGPDAQRTRVAAFAAACAGTPLARRPRWTAFDHGGATHATIRYCACCLAYRWPSDGPSGPRADGHDARWDRYCHACPLIPDDEVVHRARHRLDRAAAGG